MKAAVWGLALVSAAAGGLVVKTFSAAPAPDDSRVDAIADRLAAIEERITGLDRRVTAAAARAETPTRSAVAADESPGAGGAAAQAGSGAADHRADDLAAAPLDAPEEAEELDLEAFAARLRAGGMSRAEIDATWRRIVAAGRIDDALDLLEELAESNPSDPELQAQLGSAYIQKLMTVSDLARGEWAMRADGAFDAALKLDPKHWEARFSKAVSLAFWPPIMGKQPEAIRQFETLLSQQEESGFKADEHAQTYQFLGNLYLQSGDPAKAKEVFAKGLAAYPGNEALSQAWSGL